MNKIDPTKTPVYPEKEDLEQLRIQLSIFDKLTRSNTQILLDTCQWLFEQVERIEKSNDWWLINANPNQVDRHFREVLGYSDQDIAELEERGRRVIDELKKKFNPDGSRKSESNGSGL